VTFSNFATSLTAAFVSSLISPAMESLSFTCYSCNEHATHTYGHLHVKTRFPLPSRDGIKGRGNKTRNCFIIHPHPPPSKGEGFFGVFANMSPFAFQNFFAK
jgi:hypothetical protein